MSEKSETAESSSVAPTWLRRGIFLWWGTGVGLWATWSLATQLRSLLTQFVLALFISFALEPVVDKLIARGIRRSTSTAIALLTLIAGIIVFLALMGNLIATQLADLVDELPGYLDSTQSWLLNNFNIKLDTASVVEQLQTGGALSQFASGLGDLVTVGTTAASAMFQALTVMLFAFYLTADGPRLRSTVCSFFPEHRQRVVLEVWEVAINKTGAYISSRLLMAVISALFHGILFAILGLPSAVALALWVGLISQFIPAIGTYIAGVLPVLVALGVDPKKAVAVIIAVVVYQQIENYLLQPRITAQTLNLHPGVSIAAVLVGASLFGATGAFLALPVIATMSGFVAAYFSRHDVVEARLTAPINRTQPS